MAMLRAASVGLGWWGCELAKAAMKSSDSIALARCFSPDEAEMESFAAQFGAVPSPSFDAILRDDAIDAVLLATPHSTHALQVERAAGAGKHIFVEKPFTLTRDSAVAAASAAASAGRVLAVGHNRRFSAAARKLKRMVVGKAFGQLLHAEANFSVNSAMRYTPDFWRADRSEAKGGALASLGLHMVDVMTWLFGPVKRVSGLCRRVAVPVDIDDVSVGLLDFENGMTATLTTLFASPLVSHLRISGTACVADIEDDFGKIRLRRDDGRVEETVLDPVDTVHTELEHFVAACLHGKKLLVTPAQAIGNVAVMEAFVESASHDGRWAAVQN